MNFKKRTRATNLVVMALASCCLGKTLPTEAPASSASTASTLTDINPVKPSKAGRQNPATKPKREIEKVLVGRSPGGFQRGVQAQLQKFFAEKAALKAAKSLVTDMPESFYAALQVEPALSAAEALPSSMTEREVVSAVPAQNPIAVVEDEGEKVGVTGQDKEPIGTLAAPEALSLLEDKADTEAEDKVVTSSLASRLANVAKHDVAFEAWPKVPVEHQKFFWGCSKDQQECLAEVCKKSHEPWTYMGHNETMEGLREEIRSEEISQQSALNFYEYVFAEYDPYIESRVKKCAQDILSLLYKLKNLGQPPSSPADKKWQEEVDDKVEKQAQYACSEWERDFTPTRFRSFKTKPLDCDTTCRQSD